MDCFIEDIPDDLAAYIFPYLQNLVHIVYPLELVISILSADLSQHLLLEHLQVIVVLEGRN